MQDSARLSAHTSFDSIHFTFPKLERIFLTRRIQGKAGVEGNRAGCTQRREAKVLHVP